MTMLRCSYDCQSPHVQLCVNSRSISTGKERDTETGNDYFGARYYNSDSGRFLSPDWSAKIVPVPYATLGDPQSLNLFAYVRNNPLASVDPDGHLLENSLFPNIGGMSDPAVAAWQAGSDAIVTQALVNKPAEGLPFITMGGIRVRVTVQPDNNWNIKGAIMNASPAKCRNCRWVQIVTKTGHDAQGPHVDSFPNSPLYPSWEGMPPQDIYDNPGNYIRSGWQEGGGTFSATTVLGIPDSAHGTFKVLGAFSWGYSINSQGTLKVRGPAITGSGAAMKTMHEGFPSWRPVQ